MVVEPRLHELASAETAMVWEWPEPMTITSSAAVGGGSVSAPWLLNLGVALTYRRTDLDAHIAEVAGALGLRGRGPGLLTAADVAEGSSATVDGVRVDVTIGLSKPTWAADESGGFADWGPGTVNVVAQFPFPLEPGAAVNAVITATEAKSQALAELGVPGTGTASDAVAIVAPPARATGERFAGPRSPAGAALARAAHRAVLEGGQRWLDLHRG